LNSDFIHEQELGPLLKKAEQGAVKILWIPVRASSYEQTPLERYQALYDASKPLADMSKAKRDRAWVQICKRIKKEAGQTDESWQPPRMGHGSELSTMETRALLEASIGSDAYLAAEATIEIEKRGADETKRVFDADWQKAPEWATTENFLRDVFCAFGEHFAYHLVDVLEKGARSAVDVAI
jgi:hypothetical protein